jgi:hypothetical protein
MPRKKGKCWVKQHNVPKASFYIQETGRPGSFSLDQIYHANTHSALIIGINYFGTKHQLNGCINDAMNMRNFLVRDRGFSPSHHDMVVMTDAPENRGTPFEPIGANIMHVCSTYSSLDQECV